MKEIELTVHSTTTMSEGTIAAKIFTGMCLTAGVITAVYQSVHKKSSDGEKQKERLDDYSYRDLFHFFINPEFHWEKLHLAKGWRRIPSPSRVSFARISCRIQRTHAR